MKCKGCGNEFTPIYRNGILVSKLCISCLVKKGKDKIRKKEKAENKQIREKLKTKSEWLNNLQRVFNKYIRLRDKDKPCISCGSPLSNKFDAGHFFSVGAYPNLRFYEDNVHGQCVCCNQHKHGNTSEYAINLPIRIGKERFEKLLSERNNILNLSIEGIKDKISYYKQKCKELEYESRN